MPNGYIKSKDGTPVEIVDKIARDKSHEHTNKNILDDITEEKVARWDADASVEIVDASTNKSKYTLDELKAFIDGGYGLKVNGYLSLGSFKSAEPGKGECIYMIICVGAMISFIYVWSDKSITTEITIPMHTHTNLSVLNGITADKVAKWDSPPSVEIYDSTTYKCKYSLDELKAFINDGYILMMYGYLSLSSSVSSDPDRGEYVCVNLYGAKAFYQMYVWSDKSITSANADIIPMHTHPNLLDLNTITDEKIKSWDSKSTFSGSYNDLSDKPTIPDPVTDDHINSLIDTKLGVIENGSY